MKYTFQLISLVFLVVTSSVAMATTMCATSDVHLSTMQLVSGGSVLNLPTAPPPLYDADGRTSTSCVGLLSGNDKPLPGTNIGEYQDGLLNGETKPHGGATDPSLHPNNTLFDPFYDESGPLAQDGSEGYNNILFINPETDLQDLDDTDGNTNKTDPGWVFLGKQEGGDFVGSIAGKDLEDDEGEDISINIDDVLSVVFSCSYTDDFDVVFQVSITSGECEDGQWAISPVANIVEILEPVFGNGFFDHLAFIFKAGNDFAIYDFNFKMINSELGNTLDLTVPYNLTGTFNMTGTFGNTAISHISLWARDPAGFTTTEMPEPKSTMLMLLAVALLVLRVKSKHSLL